MQNNPPLELIKYHLSIIIFFLILFFSQYFIIDYDNIGNFFLISKDLFLSFTFLIFAPIFFVIGTFSIQKLNLIQYSSQTRSSNFKTYGLFFLSSFFLFLFFIINIIYILSFFYIDIALFIERNKICLATIIALTPVLYTISSIVNILYLPRDISKKTCNIINRFAFLIMLIFFITIILCILFLLMISQISFK